METMQCRSCAYYIQHYGLSQKRIYRLYCGHCTKGRLRNKKPDAAACELFVPGEENEEAFASKNYLTKKLLDYVFEMELLPQIEEKAL